MKILIQSVEGTPPSWLVYLEAKYSRNIALGCILWLEVPIGHQKQVRKCSAEISSVNIYRMVKKLLMA